MERKFKVLPEIKIKVVGWYLFDSDGYAKYGTWIQYKNKWRMLFNVIQMAKVF